MDRRDKEICIERLHTTQCLRNICDLGCDVAIYRPNVSPNAAIDAIAFFHFGQVSLTFNPRHRAVLVREALSPNETYCCIDNDLAKNQSPCISERSRTVWYRANKIEPPSSELGGEESSDEEGDEAVLVDNGGNRVVRQNNADVINRSIIKILWAKTEKDVRSLSKTILRLLNSNCTKPTASYRRGEFLRRLLTGSATHVLVKSTFEESAQNSGNRDASGASQEKREKNARELADMKARLLASPNHKPIIIWMRKNGKDEIEIPKQLQGKDKIVYTSYAYDGAVSAIKSKKLQNNTN